MEERGWLTENRWISLPCPCALAPRSPAYPSSACCFHTSGILLVTRVHSSLWNFASRHHPVTNTGQHTLLPAVPRTGSILSSGSRAKEKSRLWSIDVLKADPQDLVPMKNNLCFHLQRWLILHCATSLTANEYLGMQMQLGSFKQQEQISHM